MNTEGEKITKEQSSKETTPSGFAKAFKFDIGREKDIVDEDWEISSGKSLLMNEIRQNIFKYLCEYPCSSLSTLASDLKLSPSTVSWHIKLLVERKLLKYVKSNSQKLYYPANIVDLDVLPVLSLLANPKIHDIFIQIRDIPGITQKELTIKLGMSHQSINSFTNRLKTANLISTVQDGKFIRYYPTNKLKELEDDQRKNLKEFRKWIIKVLKFDGVNPKLIRVTDRYLYLNITMGVNTESLIISVNPFITVIHDKNRFLTEL